MRFTKILVLTALAALVIAPAAFALRFTDESFNTPTGETGKAYSFQFRGRAAAVRRCPISTKCSRALCRPGLSLSSSGLISGTPTVGGGWSFWVELSDQNPPSQSWCVPSSAQRQFSITVVAGLIIQQNSLRPTGDEYALQRPAHGDRRGLAGRGR